MRNAIRLFFKGKKPRENFPDVRCDRSFWLWVIFTLNGAENKGLAPMPDVGPVPHGSAAPNEASTSTRMPPLREPESLRSSTYTSPSVQ